MAANEAFKDLDVTPDELERLQSAMKDEKFRKLFVEYAEEISNPDNRKKHEEEIAELERNRGIDVKFINPEPGFVIKTSADGERKAFVNFAQNGNVNQPKSQFAKKNGKSGYQWTIPHSLSPSREDFDKSGNKCLVFDCVFNPECFKIAQSELHFKQMIENTAFDAIEREFKVKLDRDNCKQLKNMKYKGRASSTVVRTESSLHPGTPLKEDGVSTLELPYPYDTNHTMTTSGTDINSNKKTTPSKVETGKATPASSKRGSAVDGGEGGNFTVPQYTITHRGLLDLQQFINAPDSRPSTRPQELVIKIALPLLKSASGIHLDVFEKRLYLESSSTAFYKLDLPLPFPVHENNGSAKFDKSKSSMVVTLPVQPPVTPHLPSFSPSSDERPLADEVNLEDLPSKIPSGAQTNDNNNAAVHPSGNDTDSSRRQNVTAESIGPGNGPLNTPKDNRVRQQSQHVKAVESNKEIPPPEDSLCPEFSFHQNDDTVTIIADVQSASNVQSEPSHDGRECSLEIQTSKNELLRLQLLFPETVAIRRVTYDAGSHNVVFILHKTEESLGEWQSFMAGPDKNNLQLKKFTTKRNIVQSLKDVSDQSWTEKSARDELKSARVVTNGGGDDKVVIELQIGPKAEPLNGGGESTGVDDVQSSSAPASVVQGPPVTRSSEGDSVGNVCQEKESVELSLDNQGSGNSSSVAGESPSSVEGIDSNHDQVEQETKTITGTDCMESKTGSTASEPTNDLQSVEAQLSIALPDTDPSDTTSSPSVTSPMSPHSLLKSSFRSPRQRSSKSVSFCDEVVVGTFTPARGKKGRKKSPYIRQSKAKLKAPSQEVCSDSEIFLSYRDTDDSEEDLWNILPPRRVLHRQSSSESESDALGSPKGKSKKSKGSRQRRKEKARRALMSESSAEECENEAIKEVDDVFDDGSRKLGAKPGKLRKGPEGTEHILAMELPSAESTQMTPAGDGAEGESKVGGQLGSTDPGGDIFEGEEGVDVLGDEEASEWTKVSKKGQVKSERAAELYPDSNNQGGNDEEVVGGEESHCGSTSVDGVETKNGVNPDSEENGSDWTTVTKKRHRRSSGSRSESNHSSEEVNEAVGSGGPTSVGGGESEAQKRETLDELDHHTRSSFNFSNKVMFDLDD